MEVGGGGDYDSEVEICWEEEQVYFITANLGIHVDGGEDRNSHGGDDDDGNGELSTNGNFHTGQEC